VIGKGRTGGPCPQWVWLLVRTHKPIRIKHFLTKYHSYYRRSWSIADADIRYELQNGELIGTGARLYLAVTRELRDGTKLDFAYDKMKNEFDVSRSTVVRAWLRIKKLSEDIGNLPNTSEVP